MAKITADEAEYTFKVVVVGDSGVGKSNLLVRYTNDQFPYLNSTIGWEMDTFFTAVSGTNGKKIKLYLWDTAGQEKFGALTSINYRNAVGALMVYDICRRETFVRLNRWLEELRQYTNKDIVIILVGNKCDLEGRRTVSRAEGQTYAEENGLKFIESSAIKSINVHKALNELVTDLYQKYTTKSWSTSDTPPRSPNIRVSAAFPVTDQQRPAKSSCC